VRARTLASAAAAVVVVAAAAVCKYFHRDFAFVFVCIVYGIVCVHHSMTTLMMLRHAALRKSFFLLACLLPLGYIAHSSSFVRFFIFFPLSFSSCFDEHCYCLFWLLLLLLLLCSVQYFYFKSLFCGDFFFKNWFWLLSLLTVLEMAEAM